MQFLNRRGLAQLITSKLRLLNHGFSNDLKQFGNKRNSMRNLMAGITRALEWMEKRYRRGCCLLWKTMQFSRATSCNFAHAGTRMASDPLLARGQFGTHPPSVLIGNMTRTERLEKRVRIRPRHLHWLQTAHSYQDILLRFSTVCCGYVALLRDADRDNGDGQTHHGWMPFLWCSAMITWLVVMASSNRRHLPWHSACARHQAWA